MQKPIADASEAALVHPGDQAATQLQCEGYGSPSGGELIHMCECGNAPIYAAAALRMLLRGHHGILQNAFTACQRTLKTEHIHMCGCGCGHAPIDGHFAYKAVNKKDTLQKAVNNNDTFHMKHEIIYTRHRLQVGL